MTFNMTKHVQIAEKLNSFKRDTKCYVKETASMNIPYLTVPLINLIQNVQYNMLTSVT